MNGLDRFIGSDGQGGQAVVLLAILMTAMLMIVGLAIDAGQLYAAKRTMQEAADAGAFAGAVVIYQGGTPALAGVAARNDAARNGYTDGGATTVTVNSPPTSGQWIGDQKVVEVIIVQQVRTALVPGQSALNPVRARGVAAANPGKSPFAIVLLKPTGPCITMGGTGGLTVPNGVDLGGMIQANCSGTSFQITGSGKVTDALGTRTVGTANPAQVVGPLAQNAAKLADPFASFPKPVTTGLPTFGPGFTVPASACAIATPLAPGVYVGGITNNNNCNVYLGSGVYILKGGGFRQNASSGNIVSVPGGAFIFNTHSNYPGAIGSGSCGGIDAQSGGGFNTYALATGLYAGMALYQDRACTNTISITSNGSYFFHGTLYAPSALLDLQSQSPLTLESQLVVSAINFQSSGDATVNYHPSLSANSGLPTLVE